MGRVTPILRMRKLRFREAQQLCPSARPTAGPWAHSEAASPAHGRCMWRCDESRQGPTQPPVTSGLDVARAQGPWLRRRLGHQDRASDAREG